MPNSIDQLPFSFQKIFLKHNTSCFFFFYGSFRREKPLIYFSSFVLLGTNFTDTHVYGIYLYVEHINF